MPFSLRRFILGDKSSTYTDNDDAIPCRPVQITKCVDTAAPTKPKSGLKEFCGALRHRFHFRAPSRVPAGHEPLTIVNHNASYTPNLPHIPRVASTLRQDIRKATRNALLAAANEANEECLNKKITVVPQRACKRRSQSSSVLGATDLPRPRIAEFNATLDSSLLANGVLASDSSSEYIVRPDVPPLYPLEPATLVEPPSSTSIPSTPNANCPNWYTAQYLEDAARFSLPPTQISDVASSPPRTPYRLPPFSLPLDSNQVFEPRPTQISLANVNERIESNENLHENTGSAELPEGTPSHLDAETIAADRVISSGTVVIRRHKHRRNASLSLDASTLSYLAPEVTLRSSSEHRVQYVRESSSPSVEQIGSIVGEVKNAAENYTSIFFDAASKCMEKDSKGKGNIHPITPVSHDLTSTLASYPFTREMVENAIAGVPNLSDVLTSRTYSNASPRRKMAIVTNLRRITSLVSNLEGEFQEIYNPGLSSREQKVSNFAELISELHDLKEHWHLDDDDFVNIDDKIAEICDRHDSVDTNLEPQKWKYCREEATKKALSCMQARLASSKRKLEDLLPTRDFVDSSEHDFHSSELSNQLQVALDEIDRLNEIVVKQTKHIEEVEAAFERLQHEVVEVEARLEEAEQQLQHTQKSLVQQNSKYQSLDNAFEEQQYKLKKSSQQVIELCREMKILKIKEEASRTITDRIIKDKLMEIASKDHELEYLRQVRTSELVSQEMSQLHEALRESAKEKVEALRQAEDAINLLKSAHDRHFHCEHDIQTAKIAQTFAQLSQRAAEDASKEIERRAVELETERDQAMEERDLAFEEIEQWRETYQQHYPHAKSSALDASGFIAPSPVCEHKNDEDDACSDKENHAKGFTLNLTPSATIPTRPHCQADMFSTTPSDSPTGMWF